VQKNSASCLTRLATFGEIGVGKKGKRNSGSALMRGGKEKGETDTHGKWPNFSPIRGWGQKRCQVACRNSAPLLKGRGREEGEEPPTKRKQRHPHNRSQVMCKLGSPEACNLHLPEFEQRRRKGERKKHFKKLDAKKKQERMHEPFRSLPPTCLQARGRLGSGCHPTTQKKKGKGKERSLHCARPGKREGTKFSSMNGTRTFPQCSLTSSAVRSSHCRFFKGEKKGHHRRQANLRKKNEKDKKTK